MNRKRRKIRLKKLNAQRKEHRKRLLSNSFLGLFYYSTADELFERLEWLYYEYAWVNAGEKVKARIDYLEQYLERYSIRDPTITPRLQKWKRPS